MKNVSGGRKGENVFNKSAHLFTLSIINQDTQNTIENEEKTTSDQIQKQRTNHRHSALEKNNSHKKLVLQVEFEFFWEIFILSGSRCIFLKV